MNPTRASTTTPPRARHLFACFLAGATAFLILWGGFVTSHGAALAVPDWPSTYGRFALGWDERPGNVFWEHTHREIASAVGLLTLIFTIWTLKAEPRRWVRWLAIAALDAVVAQGILGGITVWLRLPKPVSIGHACLAQIFFCLTLTLAAATSARYGTPSLPRAARAGLPPWLAFGAVGLVFFQLLAGAVMRHTQSGLAVLDFPWAYGALDQGALLPSLSESAIARYNTYRNHVSGWLEPVTRGQIVTHMVHRLGAVVVSLFLLALVFHVLRRRREWPALSAMACVLGALLAVQWVLGAATVLTLKAPILTSFHVVTGALILGTTWLMAFWSWQRATLPAPPSDEAAMQALRLPGDEEALAA